MGERFEDSSLVTSKHIHLAICSFSKVLALFREEECVAQVVANAAAVLGTKKERTMRGVQQKNVKYKSS